MRIYALCLRHERLHFWSSNFVIPILAFNDAEILSTHCRSAHDHIELTTDVESVDNPLIVGHDGSGVEQLLYSRDRLFERLTRFVPAHVSWSFRTEELPGEANGVMIRCPSTVHGNL